jgi:hypothetical protein
MKTYRNTLRFCGDDAAMECVSKEVFTTTVEIISRKQKVIICPLFSRFCLARRAGLSLLLCAFAGFRFGLLLLSASAQEAIQEPSVAPPTLLVAIDHRPTISLNGDWHTIADPYGTGLYTSTASCAPTAIS